MESLWLTKKKDKKMKVIIFTIDYFDWRGNDATDTVEIEASIFDKKVEEIESYRKGWGGYRCMTSPSDEAFRALVGHDPCKVMWGMKRVER